MSRSTITTPHLSAQPFGRLWARFRLLAGGRRRATDAAGHAQAQAPNQKPAHQPPRPPARSGEAARLHRLADTIRWFTPR